MERKKFGLRMKEYRNRMGLSQEKLGEIVDLTSATISYLENGKRTMSLTKLIEVANALRCSTDDLLLDSLMVKSESVSNEATRIAALLDGCSEEKAAFVYKHLEKLMADYDEMKASVMMECRKDESV